MPDQQLIEIKHDGIHNNKRLIVRSDCDPRGQGGVMIDTVIQAHDGSDAEGPWIAVPGPMVRLLADALIDWLERDGGDDEH